MRKALSCMLSFLPLVLIIFTVVVMLAVVLFVGDGTMTAGQTALLSSVFIIELFAVALTFILMVLYMVKACRNPELSTGMKILWCVLLYMFNIFIYPVFWFLYIRQEYWY